MKYQSKPELIRDIHSQHDLLCARLDAIQKSRWREPGVCGDDWSVTDLVAHLAEWQFMFLTWYEAGRKGLTPGMPAPGLQMERDAKAEPGNLVEKSFSGRRGDEGRIREKF